MTDFAQKRLLLRLLKSGWKVNSDRPEYIQAHKETTADSIWPFDQYAGLPWPQKEILLVGGPPPEHVVLCCSGLPGGATFSETDRSLLLASPLAAVLVEQPVYGVAVHRTHTDNSPGLSIIGSNGWLAPSELVPRDLVLASYEGSDAAKAWSHGRVLE